MAVRKIRGTWYVDFYCERTRVRRKSPGFSKQAARHYERALRERLARGEVLEDIFSASSEAGTTFEAYAWEWFHTYVTTNNKPSEQHQKRCILRRHLVPYFGAMPLPEITALKVEKFKKHQLAKGLSPKTINSQLSALRRALDCAVEWELLERLPRIRRLKTTPVGIDYLTDEECDRLLAAPADDFWPEMVLVALHTGMRLGELFGLDWSALDFTRGIVTVRQSVVRGIVTSTKSHRIRHIPMTRAVRSTLEPRRKASGLVFARESGEPLGYCMAEKGLDRQCQRAGIRHIGWHTLRHTYATRLVERGVPIRVVQDLLGHSTIQMTERYAHVSPSTLRAAVELLETALQGQGNMWSTHGHASRSSTGPAQRESA